MSTLLALLAAQADAPLTPPTPARSVYGAALDVFVADASRYRVTVTGTPGDTLDTLVASAVTQLRAWAAGAGKRVPNPHLDRARVLLPAGTYPSTLNIGSTCGLDAVHIVGDVTNPAAVIIDQTSSTLAAIEGMGRTNCLLAGLTIRATKNTGGTPAALHSAGDLGYVRESYVHRCILDSTAAGYNAVSWEAAAGHHTHLTDTEIRGGWYVYNYQPNQGPTLLAVDNCTGPINSIKEEDVHPGDRFMLRAGAVTGTAFSVAGQRTHTSGGETWTVEVDPASGVTTLTGITSRASLTAPPIADYPPLDQSAHMAAYWLPDARGAAVTVTVPGAASGTMTPTTGRWYITRLPVDATRATVSVTCAGASSTAWRIYRSWPSDTSRPATRWAYAANQVLPVGEVLWLCVQASGTAVASAPAPSGCWVTDSTSGGNPVLTGLTPHSGDMPAATVTLG